MALWRVEVAEVSHRYVEADTAAHAEQIVREAVIAGLEITASTAGRELSRVYEESGPLRRKKLLASMDGLISPSSRREVRRERRRLERVVKWEEETQAWIKTQPPTNVPVPDPLMLERLARLNEIRHIEANMRRLSEWDRRSALHDDSS